MQRIGPPLATLLREVGVRPGASWVVAEGGDAALLNRSIPMAKAMDDALIAYGQNGEAIRPEQGYPLRLLVPGYEGNINIKWLRRIEVADAPFMTREETSKYTDLFPDGKAVYNVGGGVVFDSTAEEEYAECLLKARYATGTAPTAANPAST